MAKEPITLRPLPAWSRRKNILNLTFSHSFLANSLNSFKVKNL
jgi:hypothetical protein